MNANQLKGQWQQFRGDLKETWGKFTENDLLHIGGRYDRFVGKAQELYGNRKSQLMQWANAWHKNKAAAVMPDKPR